MEHLFYLKGLHAGGNSTGFCSARAHGPSTKPEDQIVLAIAPVPEQADVIILGQDERQQLWSFTLWLVPEHGRRVRSFWAQQAMMAGKTADDLLNIARSQRDRGHTFNAAILYSGAKQLSFRGPNLRIGTFSEADNEFGELTLPTELQGKPPFQWQFGSNTYHVDAVGVAEADGKLAIVIRHEVPAPADSEEATATNRKLLADFEAAHQDLADAFETIVVDIVTHIAQSITSSERTSRKERNEKRRQEVVTAERLVSHPYRASR